MTVGWSWEEEAEGGGFILLRMCERMFIKKERQRLDVEPISEAMAQDPSLEAGKVKEALPRAGLQLLRVSLHSRRPRGPKLASK